MTGATGAEGTFPATGRPPAPTGSRATGASVEAAILARDYWRVANVQSGVSSGLAAMSTTSSAPKGSSSPTRSVQTAGEYSNPLPGEFSRDAASAKVLSCQERLGVGCGSDSSPLEGEWPLPGAIPAKRDANRRLTLAPTISDSKIQGGLNYQPSTKGGIQRARIQLAEDIRQHLFSSKADTSIEDLDEACNRLEVSMEKMRQVCWGSSTWYQTDLNREDGREVGDDRGLIDSRFDHSWIPIRPGPRPGWYWIPRGNLRLDTYYPAHPGEVRRVGHLARRIRRLPPPAPLSKSFAQVVEREMANRGSSRPLKRRQERQENWQEDWMEEDDLLEEEQDLRRQIQRGPRNLGDGCRGNQGAAPRYQDRFHPSKGAGGFRPEGSRSQGFQGEWNQGQGGRFQERQGGWRHSDQRPGQAPEKDPGRERAIVISEGNKANSNPDIKCFRCLGSGHFQADCTKEPICYKCKEKGHLAIDCKSESKKL